MKYISSPLLYLNYIFQRHTVSCTHQGTLRKPSVKTRRSPFPAAFWMHNVLSGGTRRHVLRRHQTEENGNIKYIYYFLEWESNPQPVPFTVTLCAPCAMSSLDLHYCFSYSKLHALHRKAGQRQSSVKATSPFPPVFNAARCL